MPNNYELQLQPIELTEYEGDRYQHDHTFRKSVQGYARRQSLEAGSSPIHVICNGTILYGCKTYPAQ